MSNPVYIFLLTIAAALGVYAAGMIPIYGQPFDGCDGNSLLTLDAQCGIWPECLSIVLLVAPTSFFVRDIRILVSYCIMVFILGCMGGLAGIKQGNYLGIFTDLTLLYNNLYLHVIPILSAWLVLYLGFVLNRAYFQKSA